MGRTRRRGGRRLALWATTVLLVQVVAATVGSGTATAAPASGTGENAVLTWNAAAVQAIRDVAPAPPVAARALAITATAMYDAWTAYTPVAVSTISGRQVRRPPAEWTTANKREAISRAAFGALRDQFPSRATDFAAVLSGLGYDPGDLDDERKAIAEYWSDGPNSEQPPGHWNLFAQWVSRRDRHTLDADVAMFFALDNALLDASIAAWDAKRAYDRQRPITAVRTLPAGQMVRAWAGPYQGTRDIPAQGWLPYFRPDVITPPFPEYVSGHSTFSAAAATVLAAFTGSDRFGASAVVRRGRSLVEPGATPSTDVPLSWATFTAAADQAGISRRYAGIHYRSGDLAGRLLGREVGALATVRALGYLLGRR